MTWQVEAVRAALEAAGIDPMPPVTPVLCFVLDLVGCSIGRAPSAAMPIVEPAAGSVNDPDG
jgi:hypothetical protein